MKFPTKLPTKLRDAWRLILLTQKQMEQGQLFMVASSLAYTTILSIIPVLAVSFAVFKAFGGMQKVYNTIEPLILSNLAQGTGDEVVTMLHRFIDNAHTAAVGAGGMIGLVFTTMSLLSSAEKAINLIWKTESERTFFQRISSYWLFVTLGPLALSVAIGAATSFDLPLSRFFPGGTGMFLISTGIFFLIFKFVPNTRVHWKFALISSTLTAALWDLARIGYVYYAKHFVSYNAVYGSLGAVPILLIWIYIIWVIVLSGAAFTAALQKWRD